MRRCESLCLSGRPVHTDRLDDALELGWGLMVGKYCHVRRLLPELLPPLKLARRQHARNHGRKDVETRRVASSEADDELLRLVSMRNALALGHGVECVGAAVALAEAGKMVHVQHATCLTSVEPEHLLSR